MCPETQNRAVLKETYLENLSHTRDTLRQIIDVKKELAVLEADLAVTKKSLQTISDKYVTLTGTRILEDFEL